jgi:OmpA-OmpF porin, OOP family
MRLTRLFQAGCTMLLASTALMLAQDLRTVKDHPMISRFPGSDVQEYKVAEFDEYILPLGPIVDDYDKYTKSQTIEGKVTKFKYSMPANRSGLEVHRNYLDALSKAGFQVLYSCDRGTCVSPKFPAGYTTKTKSGLWCVNCEEQMRFVAAKLPRSAGDVYVTVVTEKDPYEGGVWLTIVETKPMQTGQISVNAAALTKDITDHGHAAVYGIYFDTGLAVVKPESEPALTEISKMLASNAQLKLVVVGHTDNVGTLAANLTLSKQRADAVVAALMTRYNVSPTRLQSQGAGSLAPVASNRTDEGRAKNRRVELVEQ